MILGWFSGFSLKSVTECPVLCTCAPATACRIHQQAFAASKTTLRLLTIKSKTERKQVFLGSTRSKYYQHRGKNENLLSAIVYVEWAKGITIPSSHRVSSVSLPTKNHHQNWIHRTKALLLWSTHQIVNKKNRKKGWFLEKCKEKVLTYLSGENARRGTMTTWPCEKKSCRLQKQCTELTLCVSRFGWQSWMKLSLC